MWLDAKHVPRRWSLRRRVERGGDTGPGLIQFGGPPLIRPGFGEARQCGRVGLPLCLTFGDDIRIANRHRDRAAPVAGDVAALPGTRSGLEPEISVQPERSDSSHVRAPVLVHCREPRRASVVAVRSRWRSGIELFDDVRPLHWGQPVRRTQIDDVHYVLPSGSRATLLRAVPALWRLPVR